MNVPLESKVSLPAVAGGAFIALAAALYKAILAFGLFHPTPMQTTALVAVGGALLYLTQVVVGYYAPHTARLGQHGDLVTTPAADVGAADAGAMPGGFGPDLPFPPDPAP